MSLAMLPNKNGRTEEGKYNCKTTQFKVQACRDDTTDELLCWLQLGPISTRNYMPASSSKGAK